MKFSTVAVAAACASVVSAAPKWGSWPQGPFKFTSTYSVTATPNQVVNGTTNPTFTGGLPVSTSAYNMLRNF